MSEQHHNTKRLTKLLDFFRQNYALGFPPVITCNFRWFNWRSRRLYSRSCWRTRPPGSYHAQGRKRLAHHGCQSRLSAFGFLCELQNGEVCRKSPEWAGAICDSTFYRKIHGWHFAFDTDTAARTWISKQDRTKVSPTTATPTAETYIHRVSSELLQEERQNASCNSSAFHRDRE